jgi:hypothetical protein
MPGIVSGLRNDTSRDRPRPAGEVDRETRSTPVAEQCSANTQQGDSFGAIRPAMCSVSISRSLTDFNVVRGLYDVSDWSSALPDVRE